MNKFAENQVLPIALIRIPDFQLTLSNPGKVINLINI